MITQTSFGTIQNILKSFLVNKKGEQVLTFYFLDVDFLPPEQIV